MKKIVYAILTVSLISMFTSSAFAQDIVPTMINYQGFLTDQSGTALTGAYQITFALYSDSSGAASIVWDETHNAVNIENGLFNVLLGSIDTLTADDLSGERYLGIRMAGEPEMTPRMRLASVAFSLQAEEANNAKTINNFRIVSGRVAGNGTGTGNGFTSQKNSSGNYAITFVPGFSANPVVLVTGNGGVSPEDNFWMVTGTTNSSAVIKSYDHTGTSHTPQDAGFNFIAIGLR
jgi:hypothetical protein